MRAQRRERFPAWAIGLVMVVILAVGSVLAYTKDLPWTDKFTVSATFESAQNLRPSSPVRIAGVNVGKVTKVELLGPSSPSALASSGAASTEGDEAGGAQVTFELDENALPLHEDALLKIRPRLFLEGNYFVELQPGSPSAPEVDDGHSFPVNQTAHAVQIDQVLSTLQSDVRVNLQILLRELGAAFTVYGGGDGFRQLHKTSPAAYKFTSQVNESFLGTEDGDLSGAISGLEKVLGGLAADEEELSGLITEFATFTGSFAAEDEALARAIDQLPDTLAAGEPAFTSLNESFPALRAFAVEALPGVRSSAPSLRASRPFFEQLRLLMGEPELRGLVSDLRPTVPELARLARTSVGLFEEQRSLSSCFNEVVVPWSKDEVEPVDPANLYDHDPTGVVFEETSYGITGTAVESRSGDANGQHLRVLAGSGANLIRTPDVGGLADDAFALTPFPVLGAMPALTDSAKTQFRPNVDCETQEPPNLQGGLGAAPPDQTPLPLASRDLSSLSGPGAAELNDISDTLNELDVIGGLLDGGAGEAAARQRLKDAQKALDAAGIGIDLTQAAEGFAP